MTLIAALLFLTSDTLPVDTIPISIRAQVYNPKEIYFSYEPIWVEYSFTNISSDTIWIELPFVAEGATVAFIITAENGREHVEYGELHVNCGPLFLPMPVKQGKAYKKWETQTLKQIERSYHDIAYWKGQCLMITPGEKITYYYDISRGKDTGAFCIKSILYKSLICSSPIPGHPIVPDFPSLWKGKIEAPISAKVTIKEPQGQEKEALNAFLKMDSAREIPDKIRCATGLINTYPNSIYSLKVRDYLITIKSNDSSKTTEIRNEIDKLIALYPDSPYALSYKNNKLFLQR